MTFSINTSFVKPVFAFLAGVIEITFTRVPWSRMIFRKEITCW